MTSGPGEPGEQFEEPQEGAEEDAELGPPADAEPEAGVAGLGPSPETLPEIPPALLDAKRGIEEQLLQRAEQYATLEARELGARETPRMSRASPSDSRRRAEPSTEPSSPSPEPLL